MPKLGNKKSSWKVQRALGVELPGLGKAGALERRPYPPGQHGAKRRKFSEYGLRLREKQKVLFHYGLREEQLKRFVRKAKSSPATDWMDTLIGDLECRLDNLIFRLGFAPSIPAARQMARHNHVLVNGKRVNIPSYIVKVGSRIALTEKAYQSPNYIQARQRPRLLMADFLNKETVNGQEVGVLRVKPHAGDIPFEFEKSLVTEFYSKLG
jgi:small subunit ribosomal protein S4